MDKEKLQAALERMRRVPMPPEIAALPRNAEGWPVPYFTPNTGHPNDIALADSRKRIICIRENRCWVCGKIMRERVQLSAGGFHFRNTMVAFVGGPRALENRIYGDFPCHEACAVFSACACPHLNNPDATYHKFKDMPEGTHTSAGLIMRHPQVVMVSVALRAEFVRIGKDVYARPVEIQRVRYFHRGEEIDEAASNRVLQETA